MARDAKAIGVDGLLMSYPNSFYPRTSKELYDYTRAVCEASDLGVMLFCAPHFNFGRLDPSGFPLDVWRELARHRCRAEVRDRSARCRGQPGMLRGIP